MLDRLRLQLLAELRIPSPKGRGVCQLRFKSIINLACSRVSVDCGWYVCGCGNGFVVEEKGFKKGVILIRRLTGSDEEPGN
jgi:hypothetical protein